MSHPLKFDFCVFKKQISAVAHIHVIYKSVNIPILLWMVILVSYGCHHKAPQTGWLKTTELHCLTALEAKSLKSRCQQNHALSSDPCLSLPSFRRWPSVLDIPWPADIALQSLPPMSHGVLSLCVPLSYSYKDIVILV